MGDEKKIRKLRNQLDKALKKDKPKDAIQVLRELEDLEPNNARWPHRRGDVYRKLGLKNDAVQAFERAVQLYADDGFIARAVAMAKTILVIDASRSDILESVDASKAQELSRQSRVPASITGVGQASLLSHAAAQSRRPSQVEAPSEIKSEAPPADLDFKENTIELEIDLDLSATEVGERLEAMPELSEEADAPSAESLSVMPLFTLFTEVPKDALTALATGSELVERVDAETVVKKGDPADALYAVVEGCARVEVPGLASKAPVLLVEGDLFGESCLLEDEPRNADVVVFGKLTALKIPKSVLLQAVGQFPEVGDVLFQLLTRRLVGNLMQTSPLFAAFDTESRREVAKLFEVHRVPKGTLLMTEGQKTDGLYIPLTGRLEVDDGSKHGPGAIVGQEALLSRAFSANTVRTGQEMAVLRLPGEAFSTIVAQYPPVLAHLAELSGP